MNENKEEVTININTEDNIEPFQEVKEEQPKVEEKKEEKKSPLLKIIIIIIICFVALIGLTIGLILFFALHDWSKIEWNKEYGVYNSKILSHGNAELAVKAYDKDGNEIKNITFTATCGEIVNTDGWKVTWKIPDENKKCTITAKTPKGKKVKKSFIIYKTNRELPAGIKNEEPETEETDSDGDGITNFKEKEIGTDPYLMDTDSDGLIDKIEVEYTKTDPLKTDTDEDGIKDGDEIELELDPLKKDSKGDGVNDSDRTLTYEYNEEDLGVKLKITGKGNLASTFIDTISIPNFKDVNGLLDKAYDFYTDGKLDNAEVRIKYNLAELNAKGINEDDLTLYYFNEDEKKLEKVETTVDKVNKELIVKLNHFSKYVIGSTTIEVTELKADVVFVIDNSGSMYTDDQMHAAGRKFASGMNGNDPDFKRIELTKEAINKFNGNYRFAIGEFAGNYKTIQGFTNDKNLVKTKADSMKSNWQVQLTGTDIVSALRGAINEFGNDKNGHYVLLMTDGEDTTGRLSSSKSQIINSAKAKNVKVCVIGLGSELNNDDLNEIAKETGCVANSVTKAEGLNQLYEIVGSNINYGLTDLDGDGVSESRLIADSGFITLRDGFNFPNPGYIEQETGGQCYGMAFFASLYYQQKLPLKEGPKKTAKLGFIYPYESIGYDLSGTYFEDQTKNLYDYYTKDPALQYLRDVSDTPPDYRDRVENGVFKISDKYRDMFNKSGVMVKEVDWKGEIEGKKYTKVERARIDITNEKFKEATPEDYQLHNAIWWLFIHQNQMKGTSFANTPDKAYEELIENLKNGIPQPINIGSHGINIIRAYINVTKPEYKFEVYDNNFPGETRYISVRKTRIYSVEDNIKYAIVDPLHPNPKEQFVFEYDKDKNGTPDNIKVDLSYINIE